MGQLKFISREKLVEYLDEELRQFLNEHRLYEINQYGWLNDGEQDPLHLGHALWQENPPELKQLIGLGDDFTNLMRSARHSLGLAYFFHNATDSLLNDSGYYFSYHFADTATKLHLASNRIRDLFIAVFVNHLPATAPWMSPGKDRQRNNTYQAFRAPFLHIRDQVATWDSAALPLRECLANLLPLTEELAHNQSANQDPCQHLTLFHNRIIAAVTNMAMGYPDDASSDDLSSTCNSSSSNMVGWYEALIKVSNHVFMAEHLLRELTSQAEATPRRSRNHKVS